VKPDFGTTAEDYSRHRAGFPDALFDRLRDRGIGLPGQTVVDLGTGTGTLARGFARRGCRVIGIDPSEPMLRAARVLDDEAGIYVEYRVARAEASGLPSASAHVVCAGQCWHWFDRPRAALEALRVLRRGGRMLIAHFDWLPLPGNVVRATEELIEAHNPAWKLGWGTGVHPYAFGDLAEAGFLSLESFSFDVDVPYTREAWRGRIRASAGVGGTLDAPSVARFDRVLEALLAERFPAPTLRVPHRVFALCARSPA
jgi:SAM-dependent methyltransferase